MGLSQGPHRFQDHWWPRFCRRSWLALPYMSFSRSRGVHRVVNKRTGDVRAEFAYNCVYFFIITVPDDLKIAAVVPGHAHIRSKENERRNIEDWSIQATPRHSQQKGSP